MKKKALRPFAVLTALILVLTVLSGCSESLGDETGPEEITTNYLEGEYAQQLLNDGAKYYFGSIELDLDDDGQILMKLHTKEWQGGGKEVINYALIKEFILSEYAETTFLPGGTSEPLILTGSEFYQEVQKDYLEYSTNFEEYGDYKYYHVYVLDDVALLVIAQYVS